MNVDRKTNAVKIGLKTSVGTAEREWVWAIEIAPNQYRIENIPFFVDGVNLEDVVTAKADLNGQLHLGRVLLPSGHRTFRMALLERLPDEKRRTLVAKLTSIGCLLERGHDHYAVSVPPTVDLDHTLAILDSERDLSIWEFERAG